MFREKSTSRALSKLTSTTLHNGSAKVGAEEGAALGAKEGAVVGVAVGADVGDEVQCSSVHSNEIAGHDLKLNSPSVSTSHCH